MPSGVCHKVLTFIPLDDTLFDKKIIYKKIETQILLKSKSNLRTRQGLRLIKTSKLLTNEFFTIETKFMALFCYCFTLVVNWHIDKYLKFILLFSS